LTDTITQPSSLIATWCRLCGTEHAPEAACPRQVLPEEPEKPRWRVAVETPLGVRGYGVLVAKAGPRWVARILTFPNILWMVPGGGEPMKFLAKSEDEAVRRAADFIRRHCVVKGYLMRDEVELVEPWKRGAAPEGAPEYAIKGAPRFDRRLPIHFGRSRPTILGHTANLSEAGLFVATETPLCSGEQLGLLLELEHCKVPLRGGVRWRRDQAVGPLDCGMGLRLVNAPNVYVSYVRALA
jgi:hypothetical protein